MNAPFSSLVLRAQQFIRQTKEDRNHRDIALFRLACYISSLRTGALVTLGDGRQAKVPLSSSPADICGMTFSKEGLQTETLGVILGLDGNANVIKYIRAGALKSARLQSGVMGLNELSDELAAKAALTLAKQNWPEPGMAGAFRLSGRKFPDEPNYLPSFHWPQVAWTELYDYYQKKQHKKQCGKAGYTTSSQHEACGSWAASPSFQRGFLSNCNSGMPSMMAAMQAAEDPVVPVQPPVVGLLQAAEDPTVPVQPPAAGLKAEAIRGGRTGLRATAPADGPPHITAWSGVASEQQPDSSLGCKEEEQQVEAGAAVAALGRLVANDELISTAPDDTDAVSRLMQTADDTLHVMLLLGAGTPDSIAELVAPMVCGGGGVSLAVTALKRLEGRLCQAVQGHPLPATMMAALLAVASGLAAGLADGGKDSANEVLEMLAPSALDLARAIVRRQAVSSASGGAAKGEAATGCVGDAPLETAAAELFKLAVRAAGGGGGALPSSLMLPAWVAEDAVALAQLAMATQPAPNPTTLACLGACVKALGPRAPLQLNSLLLQLTRPITAALTAGEVAGTAEVLFLANHVLNAAHMAELDKADSAVPAGNPAAAACGATNISAGPSTAHVRLLDVLKLASSLLNAASKAYKSTDPDPAMLELLVSSVETVVLVLTAGNNTTQAPPGEADAITAAATEATKQLQAAAETACGGGAALVGLAGRQQELLVRLLITVQKALAIWGMQLKEVGHPAGPAVASAQNGGSSRKRGRHQDPLQMVGVSAEHGFVPKITIKIE